MAVIGRTDIGKLYFRYIYKSLAIREAFIDSSEYLQYSIKLAKK